MWTKIKKNIHILYSIACYGWRIESSIGTCKPNLIMLLKLQVDRMVREAEKFGKEDMEKRDAIDTKNQANSILYQIEKEKEQGDKSSWPNQGESRS